MDAVAIEVAESALVGQPLNSEEFPDALLERAGNKATIVKRLWSSALSAGGTSSTFLSLGEVN